MNVCPISSLCNILSSFAYKNLESRLANCLKRSHLDCWKTKLNPFKPNLKNFHKGRGIKNILTFTSITKLRRAASLTQISLHSDFAKPALVNCQYFNSWLWFGRNKLSNYGVRCENLLAPGAAVTYIKPQNKQQTTSSVQLYNKHSSNGNEIHRFFTWKHNLHYLLREL